MWFLRVEWSTDNCLRQFVLVDNSWIVQVCCGYLVLELGSMVLELDQQVQGYLTLVWVYGCLLILGVGIGASFWCGCKLGQCSKGQGSSLGSLSFCLLWFLKRGFFGYVGLFVGCVADSIGLVSQQGLLKTENKQAVGSWFIFHSTGVVENLILLFLFFPFSPFHIFP